MSEISRFFNSIDHDRLYSAADWAAYFKSFIGNGVMPLPSSQLLVSPGTGSGLSLSVAAGKAFINGYFYENTAAKEITLATADGTNPRIDRVIVRYSRTAREMFLTTLTGTAASSPTPPLLLRSADAWDLCLANVWVARGATSISASNITDTRGSAAEDSNHQVPCGFVSWFLNEAGDNYDDFWVQFRSEFAEFLDSADDDFHDWLDDLSEQIDPATMAGIEARFAELTPRSVSVTLPSSGWSSSTKQQTVSVQYVKADSNVIVSAAPSDRAAYGKAGIACISQAAGSLTFEADRVPTANVAVNVLVLDS